MVPAVPDARPHISGNHGQPLRRVKIRKTSKRTWKARAAARGALGRQTVSVNPTPTPGPAHTSRQHRQSLYPSAGNQDPAADGEGAGTSPADPAQPGATVIYLG